MSEDGAADEHPEEEEEEEEYSEEEEVSEEVGTGGYCSPRHPTHFDPSSLGLHGTL